MDYYYLSMKQILLTQISTLIYQQSSEAQSKHNTKILNNLRQLSDALEQIKSYHHNQYFRKIIEEFQCEQQLTKEEEDTLSYLRHKADNSDDSYTWIFYKGFKQWYNSQYMQKNRTISNTRSETLFTGAPSEEIVKQIHSTTSRNDDQHIHQIWQTLLGINLLNQYKSQQITRKHIMGKKPLIDITKCVYFERTNDQIIHASLLRLCIIQNNIFKTNIDTNVIRIYDTDIFKIVASMLWDPALASSIIQICVMTNIQRTNHLKINKAAPQNFEEAFKIQEKERLSQHKQNRSTKIDLPAIPDTPKTKETDFDIAESFKSTENNTENTPIVNDTIHNEKVNNLNEDINTSNSGSASMEIPTTETAMMDTGCRPSINLDEEEEEANEFYDHHGRHESSYSQEFTIAQEMRFAEDHHSRDTLDESEDESISINAEFKIQDENDDDRHPTDAEQETIDDESISINTEYTDEEEPATQIGVIREITHEATDSESLEQEEHEHAIDITSPQRMERTGTMVEYDVDNILSGNTVESTMNTMSYNSFFDEYVRKRSADEEDNDPIEHMSPVGEEEEDIIIDVPMMAPLNLSASVPQFARVDSGYMGGNNSKAILHGFYKNASSEEERWKRLKQRMQRHWDEDVTSKMKTFCEANEFVLEDILEDIADTMENIDSSNIISHLKAELFWNDAKSLRFYRTLRRILISRQSTQIQNTMSMFMKPFNERMDSERTLDDNDEKAPLLKDVVSIDISGHSGSGRNIMKTKNGDISGAEQTLILPVILPEAIPIYERRASHELQTEKAWWFVKQSLIQKSWQLADILAFKTLCEQDDFDIKTMVDDIGCFDSGDSLLMPALAEKLKWSDDTLSRFVEDLRLTLADDMQHIARDSRDIKREEIPTIAFTHTESISLSTSPMPVMHGGEEKEIRIFQKSSPPPLLQRRSTPATPATITSSANSSQNKLAAIGADDNLCALWKLHHVKNHNNDDMFHESQAKCVTTKVEQCAVFKRVMFIMEFYVSWVVIDQTSNTFEMKEKDEDYNEEVYHQISIYTFISKLHNYTYTQLWNDYYHIREYHSMHYNVQDAKWNQSFGETETVCIAAQCRILSRYHRQRTLCKDNETRIEIYNLKESNQTEEVITQQLCDAIHCMLYHPIAVHKSNKDGTLTQQSSTSMEDNEDNGDDDEVDADDDDEDDGNNNINKNKNKKEDNIIVCDNNISLTVVDSRLYRKLRGHRMKYHKFLVNVDNNNKNNDADNKGVNKSNTAFRALPSLSSGVNKWDEFVALDISELDQYSKYGNLQDELLNNDIANISQEQWNDGWRRAEIFGKTWKGKQMIASTNSGKLGKHKGDPIPTHYVLALMIWCNFDELQYEFREHCRCICIQQTNSSNESSNKYDGFQFSRWGFWLNATIKCYGENMQQYSEYYSCVASKVMMDKMWLKFRYPTSITRSYLITQIYSNNAFNRDGIIFVLNGSATNGSETLTRCIDCSWISDYGYEEDECLVFNGSMDIKSVDLLSYAYMHYEYCTPFIFTLKWWDVMTNITKSDKYFKSKLGDDKEKILLQLLANKELIEEEEEERQTVIIIPQYIQSLFDHLCARKCLNLNLTLLDELLLSSSIKERFIDSKDGRVDFWRLMTLFPHATKIAISLQKGLSLDSFICQKFLNVIHRWNRYKGEEFKLNVVIVMSDQQNRDLKQQTKHLLSVFSTRSWTMFFTKAGNKVKFQKNISFQK